MLPVGSQVILEYGLILVNEMLCVTDEAYICLIELFYNTYTMF